LEVLALIEKVRGHEGKSPKRPKDNEALAEYSGKTPVQLRNMLRTMLLARRIEREEKLLLRKGYNRFFIGCGGKEMIDVCFADNLKTTDPFVGYYRNKAFDLHRGTSIWEKMLDAIGDSRAQSGGMQIPSHPSIPELSIIPQASPTGSHALEAAGLGSAIAHTTPISAVAPIPGGAYPKDAITLNAIGEGSSSAAEYGRAVFYSVMDKSRNMWAIYNCGWAISVSVHEQFPDGDPTLPYRGYERYGLKIMNFDGTSIKESLAAVKEAVDYCRAGTGPVLMNIKTTREGSHSGSDDQSFYMDPVELDWHTYNDCILKTCNTFIADGIITPKEIGEIWDQLDHDISEASAKAVSNYQPKTAKFILDRVSTYDFEEIKKTWKKYRDHSKTDRAKKFKEYHDKGYFASAEVPEKVGPMTMRFAINYTLFDLFTMTDDVILFGEDVADFSGHMVAEKEKQKSLKGKGGVFLVSKNLMREFGHDRCFNTPLDEAGILGRALGHCYQGRRPFPEIQFLDYMSPAYQGLKDRIATTYQRSNTLFKMPMVIRCTQGGFKQGAGAFWHSESNMGTWLQIPGMPVIVPSNAWDAAGLLKTSFACDDPVLFLESVALYNRRDWDGVPIETSVPDIDELIPFGVARIWNEQATDVAVISYGTTVQMARKAAEVMAERGVNVRIIDLRTLRPMDEEAILKSAKECGKVLIVTEDRFPGGVGATIASVITRGRGIFDLEAPVKLLTAIDARVAYGTDGDEACLPTVEKIAAEIDDLHNNY
jgi:2-oxoisovalerate dehydrogenase E1 component